MKKSKGLHFFVFHVMVKQVQHIKSLQVFPTPKDLFEGCRNPSCENVFSLLAKQKNANNASVGHENYFVYQVKNST